MLRPAVGATVGVMTNDARNEQRQPVGTVVVLGASMAGLVAARVLSERCRRVIILERDTLPDGPEARRLVPQGRHPHLLLPSGARLFERWFPGLSAELLDAGAVEIDFCADFCWQQRGGVQRRPRSALRGPAMSRPLLEWSVRRRVAALGNVEIRDETTASGLLSYPSGDRVTGVRVDGAEDIECDLVVDATGRQARTLAWIQEMGYDAPATSVVQVETRYVSRVFRRTEAASRDWRAAAAIGGPSTKRLAMLLPMEDDRWILGIAGINGELAPSDDAGMLRYLRQFGASVIADVVATSEPLGEAVTHRYPANQRRHVERLRRFPTGWVLLGDALCSFDPIYGQGMSSAALQSEALGRALERAGAANRAFARSYFRAAGRIVNAPWSIAVGGDFAYDGTTGRKPFGTDFLNRYLDRVIDAGQRDDTVVVRLNEVVALVRSPHWLLAPALVVRVLRAARRADGVEGRTSIGPQPTSVIDA
jgi:2-polyprenyl-6-methoxyphenol hydroxylase-like FAD-dependent oxidoreductase